MKEQDLEYCPAEDSFIPAEELCVKECTSRVSLQEFGGSKRKIHCVDDTRGVAELQDEFAWADASFLEKLMLHYKRYVAARDVLRSLSGGRIQQVTKRESADSTSSSSLLQVGSLPDDFWNRQNWPRPGQAPSLISYSMVSDVVSETFDKIEPLARADSWEEVQSDEEWTQIDEHSEPEEIGELKDLPLPPNLRSYSTICTLRTQHVAAR
jgi:hypothetical protein